MHHIYIITNTINAMQYVGITKDLNRRWKQHKSSDGSSRYLHPAIKKHGIENFVFTHVADAFDLDCAKFIEKLLIKEKNTKAPFGYNLTDGGEGTIGYVFSEESKQKMRDSAKGQERSIESNIKRSITLKGNKNSLGKLRSEETRAKMSVAQTGRKHSEESRKKISKGHLGKKHSAETIAKRIGKKPSAETLEKLRLSHLGKKLSPESIAKRTATLALNKAKRLAEKETS